jgi:transcription termination factor NusB
MSLGHIEGIGKDFEPPNALGSLPNSIAQVEKAFNSAAIKPLPPLDTGDWDIIGKEHDAAIHRMLGGSTETLAEENKKANEHLLNSMSFDPAMMSKAQELNAQIAYFQNKRDDMTAKLANNPQSKSAEYFERELARANNLIVQFQSELDGTAPALPSIFNALPTAIDNSTDELTASIKRYLNEFEKLGKIKPISTSVIVDRSPLINSMDTSTEAETKRPSYQGIPYAMPTTQVAQTTSELDEEDQANTSNVQDLAKVNSNISTPPVESEINSLMKEQNKLIAALLLSNETTNKRLKTLVRNSDELS